LMPWAAASFPRRRRNGLPGMAQFPPRFTPCAPCISFAVMLAASARIRAA
jgi:hypothetical protein